MQFIDRPAADNAAMKCDDDDYLRILNFAKWTMGLLSGKLKHRQSLPTEAGSTIGVKAKIHYTSFPVTSL